MVNEDTQSIKYRKMEIRALLPPANEVCEGYVFTPVCHSVHGGKGLHRGGRGLHTGGSASGGSVSNGICILGVVQTPPWILLDTVNERVVRILLECILVVERLCPSDGFHMSTKISPDV